MVSLVLLNRAQGGSPRLIRGKEAIGEQEVISEGAQHATQFDLLRELSANLC